MPWSNRATPWWCRQCEQPGELFDRAHAEHDVIKTADWVLDLGRRRLGRRDRRLGHPGNGGEGTAQLYEEVPRAVAKAAQGGEGSGGGGVSYSPPRAVSSRRMIGTASSKALP